MPSHLIYTENSLPRGLNINSMGTKLHKTSNRTDKGIRACSKIYDERALKKFWFSAPFTVKGLCYNKSNYRLAVFEIVCN